MKNFYKINNKMYNFLINEKQNMNIIKINLLKKNINFILLDKVKTSKHFPSSVREWNNTIYVYNKQNLNLVPSATILAIKLIKSFFAFYNYKIDKRIRKKKLIWKFRRLSCNRIHISNGEYKHTNNKILINIYVFNRQKYNYILIFKKLFFRKVKKKNIISYNKLNNLKKKKINYNKLNNLKEKKINYNIIFSKLKGGNILRDTIIKKISIVNIIKIYTNLKYFNIFLNHKFLNFRLISSIKQKTINILEKRSLHTTILLKNKKIKTNINLLNTNSIYCLNKLLVLKFKKNDYNKILPLKFSNNNITKYNRLNNAYFNNNIGKKQLIPFSLKIQNMYYKKKFRNIKKLGFFLYLMYRNHGFLTRNKLAIMLFIIYRKKLLRSIKTKRYNVIRNLMKNNSWYITKYINDYYEGVINKLFKKLKLYIFYRQLLYINSSKYNYVYLQYLTGYIYNIYNKNIEYNLINIKRMYLHSDILTASILLKLTKNKRRLIRIIKGIKRKIKIRNKNYFLNKVIRKEKIDKKNFFSKKILIKQLRHKKTTGYMLTLNGRLTKRYTASRSVSKLITRGNLLNLDSSYKRNSTVLLRGSLKSSLQYTNLKSKFRIGSYGIKGWVSGN